MKKQRYIVEIEMPDGDFISAEWLKDLIQTDCDMEDESRKKVTVQETSLPSNLDEAADKYAKENCENYVDEEDGVTYIEEALRNTFKAGANWMAGLFVLVGGEPTGWFRANDGSEYATGLDLEDPIKLPVDFYVRKK